MDMIRQGLTEYSIPSYMEEILTHNYCPYFMRMTIIRDKGSYRFSYRPGNLNRIDIKKLGTYEKLLLIRSLIRISEQASGYLIRGENYLLEPELIYSTDNRVTEEYVRILFYPDVKKLRFEHKIALFAERIRCNDKKEEREIFDQLREAAGAGSLNRIKLLIDKNLTRIENRMLSKAG